MLVFLIMGRISGARSGKALAPVFARFARCALRLLLVLLAACGSEPTNRPDVEEDPSFPILDVELDAMEGRALSDDVLKYARAAFHDAKINIRFHRDDEGVAPLEFDGSISQRNAMLRMTRSDPNAVHVLVAIRRLDLPGRGGELVTGADSEESGVIVYYDELDSLHPACGSPMAAAISKGEARAGTLVHEIGHALQLGHDTEAGGGINFYNVMAVPDGCDQAQRRFHGIANFDPALGATEALQASRFSQEAIDRFDLDNIVSIHTGELVGGEM